MNLFKKLIKGLGLMNITQISGGTVTVNGRTFSNLSGNNISINNGMVMVDGKVLEDGDFSEAKVINVTVEGNCGDVTTAQGDIHCNNCRDVKTSQGSINIKGNASGNVKTSMGSIQISGSVTGNVKTSMGNISHS